MTPRGIYLAGPLFTDAEKAWHRSAMTCLRDAGFQVVWPGDLLTEKRIREAGDAAPSLIFRSCREALDNSALVVALLDGVQVDDGTAWEIGYAYAMKKAVYGVRTDSRAAGDTKFNRVNSMIEICLAGMAGTLGEVIEMLKSGSSSCPRQPGDVASR
jgi:nucleoside 2-deoxyribosyltransferase